MTMLFFPRNLVLVYSISMTRNDGIEFSSYDNSSCTIHTVTKLNKIKRLKMAIVQLLLVFNSSSSNVKHLLLGEHSVH